MIRDTSMGKTNHDRYFNEIYFTKNRKCAATNTSRYECYQQEKYVTNKHNLKINEKTQPLEKVRNKLS